jgi:hypothetical protein
MTRFGRSAMISTPMSVIAAPTIMRRSSRSPSSNTPSTTVETGGDFAIQLRMKMMTRPGDVRDNHVVSVEFVRDTFDIDGSRFCRVGVRNDDAAHLTASP